MNFYEHTLIARQDVSQSQIKQIEDKYIKIENNWLILHSEYDRIWPDFRKLDKMSEMASERSFRVLIL